MTLTASTRDSPVVVTVGLPYANGPIHVGHLRGLVVGDAFARGLESAGQPTIFVSGSDMHGTPISVNAEQEGLDPESYARQWHERNRSVFPPFNVEFDRYGHTHSDTNRRTARSIVESIEENGHVVERIVEIAWDPELDQPLDDRYVEGDCPYCGERARGDECDDGCQRHLEPGELEDPVNALTGTPAEYRSRERKFLELSDFSDTLETFAAELEGTSNAIRAARDWAGSDLEDWCISRELDWGVAYPGAEDQVLYVWVDALAGYISMTREYVEGSDSPVDDWTDLWTGDRSDVVHVIGKDIVQQHSVFWPALLDGAGFAPPRAIVATEFVTLDGEGLSTSRNLAIWADEYLETGFDPGLLRYFLLADGDLSDEIDFTWDRFRTLVNDELAEPLNGFFDLIASHAGSRGKTEMEPRDRVKQRIDGAVETVTKAVTGYRLRPLAEAPIELAQYGIDHLQERGTSVDALQLGKAVAVLSEPAMPGVAEAMWTRIGEPGSAGQSSFRDALEPPHGDGPVEFDRRIVEPVADEELQPLRQELGERLRSDG